ncbi:uncharacterized protein [Anomalospiza imberbis]|uniref:uncharacterized protein isoform X2 n=1 Tax=Anomalospiza imberbis TaxID=187417 RepID=UPI00358FF725
MATVPRASPALRWGWESLTATRSRYKVERKTTTKNNPKQPTNQKKKKKFKKNKRNKTSHSPEGPQLGGSPGRAAAPRHPCAAAAPLPRLAVRGPFIAARYLAVMSRPLRGSQECCPRPSHDQFFQAAFALTGRFCFQPSSGAAERQQVEKDKPVPRRRVSSRPLSSRRPPALRPASGGNCSTGFAEAGGGSGGRVSENGLKALKGRRVEVPESGNDRQH